jgi:hypothetical protein
VEEEAAPPAVSSTPTEKESAEAKTAQPLPANPEKAVEALEKRLEDLGGVATSDVAEEETKPAAAAPAPAPAAAKAPAGKNALLVSLFTRVRAVRDSVSIMDMSSYT